MAIIGTTMLWEMAMTPEQIKQLTPEQYGGDFELTMEVGENENNNY